MGERPTGLLDCAPQLRSLAGVREECAGIRVVTLHCFYNVGRKKGVRTLDREKGVLKEHPRGNTQEAPKTTFLFYRWRFGEAFQGLVPGSFACVVTSEK